MLTSLANTSAGQSERPVVPAPIRTPEWSSGLSGKRRILFTQLRGRPDHERHLVISFRRLYFHYIFPPYLSVFGLRTILIWGIETWLGAIPRTHQIPSVPPSSFCSNVSRLPPLLCKFIASTGWLFCCFPSCDQHYTCFWPCHMLTRYIINTMSGINTVIIQDHEEEQTNAMSGHLVCHISHA